MGKVLMMVLLLFSPLCNGAGYYGITPDERQLCFSLFGVREGSGEHICDCVRYYNRAARESYWVDRKYYAQEAVGSCTYFMVRHSKNKGHLLDQYYPAAQMYRGMAHALLKDRAKAISDLSDAVRRNPSAQAGHIHLSDLYSGFGNKSKALEVVTEGLRYLPGAKPLQRRYLSLGGKEPFPEPYQQAVDASQPTESPQNDQQHPAKSSGGDNPPALSSETNMVPPQPSLIPETEDAPIGSSTNPWCRFCPDVPAESTPRPASDK